MACTIMNGNMIDNHGGAILILNSSEPTIRNNIFLKNSAKDGGALASIYRPKPKIENNIFVGNFAYGLGGALHFKQESKPIIVNNTFVQNTASYCGGAIAAYYSFTAIIFNNIFYENTAFERNDAIFIYDYTAPCTLYVTYNNIDTSECAAQGNNELIWGAGNIYCDPLLADSDTSDGFDFHLTEGSQCIDAGINQLIGHFAADAPETDFDRDARYALNGYDIGADEYTTSGINAQEEQSQKFVPIMAYPSPFNSSINININMSGVKRIEIFNINGELVQKVAINGRMPIVWQPNDEVNSGIYLIQAITEKNITLKK